jgi:uncharacterized Zn finger protein
MNEDIMSEKQIDTIQQKIQEKISENEPEDAPAPYKWFRVGSTIQINNYLFRINRVKPREISLKLIRTLAK